MGRMKIKTDDAGKIVFIDVLKSFACLCVVIGHVIRGMRKEPIEVSVVLSVLADFVYYFHVPCFFFASGYLYANKQLKSLEEYRKFICKKLIALGIPYFACSVFYIMMGSIVSSDISFNSLPGLVGELLMAPVAQYWYLYALFEMFVIVPVIEYMFRKTDKGWILFLLIVAALGVRVDTLWIKYLVLYTCYFYLGAYFNQKNIIKKYHVYEMDSRKLLLFSGLLSVGLYGVYKYVLAELIIHKSVNNVFQGTVKLLLVGCMVMMAIAITHTDNAINRFLNRLAPYSLYIYLFHTWFTGLTRVLLCKTGIYSDWLHMLCGMAAGVAGPLVVALVIRKIPFFRFWIEPLRILGKKNTVL